MNGKKTETNELFMFFNKGCKILLMLVILWLVWGLGKGLYSDIRKAKAEKVDKVDVVANLIPADQEIIIAESIRSEINSASLAAAEVTLSKKEDFLKESQGETIYLAHDGSRITLFAFKSGTIAMLKYTLGDEYYKKYSLLAKIKDIKVQQGNLIISYEKSYVDFINRRLIGGTITLIATVIFLKLLLSFWPKASPKIDTGASQQNQIIAL